MRAGPRTARRLLLGVLVAANTLIPACWQMEMELELRQDGINPGRYRRSEADSNHEAVAAPPPPCARGHGSARLTDIEWCTQAKRKPTPGQGRAVLG